jgi:hypothetical protein
MRNTTHELEIRAKYRYEIALEYGISDRTLYDWFKEKGLKFRRRRLTIEDVALIYRTFGYPRKILLI